MYRIMLKVKEAGVDSLYRFLATTDEEGNVIPYETEDEYALDVKVESMLNNGYSKQDFIIVSTRDFNINADIV